MAIGKFSLLINSLTLSIIGLTINYNAIDFFLVAIV